MSVTLSLDWLLDYSDHERRKWREWLAADPARLQLPVQPGGRFPSVADLLDHVFLVERRHLSRLEGATPPEATGITPGDLDELFEFADLVRDDFRQYVSALDDSAADEEMVVTLASGTWRTTRRALAATIVLHEIRHFAQIALAARLAGHTPPGEHDVLFFPRTPGVDRSG